MRAYAVEEQFMTGICPAIPALEMWSFTCPYGIEALPQTRIRRGVPSERLSSCISRPLVFRFKGILGINALGVDLDVGKAEGCNQRSGHQPNQPKGVNPSENGKEEQQRVNVGF